MTAAQTTEKTRKADAAPDEVGFVVYKSGRQFGFRVRLPVALLDKIGTPKRVVFHGFPKDGFTISAVRGDVAGSLAINYANARNFAYLVPGLRQMELSKVVRSMVMSPATVVDKHSFFVRALDAGWIKAERGFTTGAHEKPQPVDARVPANPTTGLINGNGHAPPNGHDGARGITAPAAREERIADHVTNEQIRMRLGVALRQVALFKRTLEQRTGLKYAISRDWSRLVVDLAESS